MRAMMVFEDEGLASRRDFIVAGALAAATVVSWPNPSAAASLGIPAGLAAANGQNGAAQTEADFTDDLKSITVPVL